MVKFLKSYVGSKAYYVKQLDIFKGRNFVEFFCGSAVLSANLAKSCQLNDLDSYVYKILNEFDRQIVPEIFTKEDYFKVRGQEDWWKYAFCLQSMSFSGVFRYSKNGFNVPIKPIKSVDLSQEYAESLKKWMELQPKVSNLSYIDVKIDLENPILVFDPPYESSQASYNKSFDYEIYWNFVGKCLDRRETVLIFDSENNMPLPAYSQRKMRVNGAKSGSNESMFIFDESLKIGKTGEDIFNDINPHLQRENGLKFDFSYNGKKIELKTEYYDINKTENFFIERFSYDDVDGGPWQSLNNNVEYYIHFFVKNKTFFVFKTEELVNYLNDLELNLIKIPNKNHITQGFKIKRKDLSHICKKYDKN